MNSFKIIPFTAEHTYVPLYGSTPPLPPPGSKVTLTFHLPIESRKQRAFEKYHSTTIKYRVESDVTFDATL